MPSTVACLSDFAAERKGDYSLLASFCGVESLTVLNWFDGRQLPKGGTLIKLRFFLELTGYKVDELLMLSQVAYKVSATVGYGLLTTEEIKELLEFQETKGVYDVLLHGKNVQPARRYKLERLSNEWSVEIATAKARLSDYIESTSEKVTALRLAHKPQTEQRSIKANEPIEDVEANISGGVIVAAAHTIEALDTLASDIERDEHSRILRKTVGLSLDREALVRVQQWIQNVLDES